MQGLAIFALAACAGSSSVSVPTSAAAASASAVLDAYLRALVAADDCKTAHGLASSTFTYGRVETGERRLWALAAPAGQVERRVRQ